VNNRFGLQLQAALAELALAVFTGHSLKQDLQRLIRVACRLLPGEVSGSIALLADGRPSTTAVSDHVALELDMVQYETGEGPCLTALGGATVRIGILADDEQFPHFAVGAADRRIRSVLSVPIRDNGDVLGTLNLYSRQPDGFDDHARHVAEIIAAEAATAIATSAVYDEARRVRDELQSTHDEQTQISQAEGALMAIQSCTAEQAANLLAGAAAATGDTLVEVAQRILTEVTRPTASGLDDNQPPMADK